MANYTYNDITDWKMLPIDLVIIQVNSNQYSFYKNEVRTQLNIHPIMEENDEGGQTIAGFELLLEIYPIKNDMENLLLFLQDIKAAEITDLDIIMRQISGEPQVNVEFGSQTVKNWSASWEFIANKDSEIKIIIKGIFDATLIDATIPKLFTNSNM